MNIWSSKIQGMTEKLNMKFLPEHDSKIEIKLEILLNYSFWRYW